MQQQFQELLKSALQDLTLRLRASQAKSLEEVQTALRNETEKALRQQSQQLKTQLDDSQQSHAKSLADLKEIVLTQQQTIQQLQQKVGGLQQQLHDAPPPANGKELQNFQEQKSQELQRVIQQGFADLWGKMQSSKGAPIFPLETNRAPSLFPPPPIPSSFALGAPAAPPAIPPRSPAPPPPPPR